MTFRELAQWRDANELPDTWYLEIDQQGLGRVFTLADARGYTRDAWANDMEIHIVNTSMAGNDSAWIVLRSEEYPDNVCLGCGADCQAVDATFPGKGMGYSEWLAVPILIIIAIWTGAEGGAVYGWLLMLFFSLPCIALFLREKRTIWRCPVCHMVRSRKK